jgi:Ca-activated chloride channel family protein
MGRFSHQSARLTAAAALAALVAAAALAQEPVTFSVDVKLVRLLVTVKDGQGALIGSLEKQDFTVFDSGVKQEVAVFEHHTELPLSVSVLVDTSGSTGRDLEYELESVERFFAALFKEGNPADAASLYAFNDDVTLLSSFTRRQQRLRDSLRRLRASSGTSMYDAIFLASRPLEDREGRHVIVIVTDGGDTTSTQEFRGALEAAHLAEAAIYPILVVPIAGDAGRNLGGERALERLAADTGGRVFIPSVGPQLDAAFGEILRDLRTQYLVAYYPRNLPPEGPLFRPLRVEVSRPDLRATTRAGYYGDTNAR